MTDTTLPTSNQDPAAVAATIADPTNGVTTTPGTPVGIKLDSASAQAIGQHVADAINSTTGQTVEADIVSGIPKKARGVIYAGVGALGTAASSILGFAATNPGLVPNWLLLTAALVAAPAGAVVGSSAFANLGKK